MVNTTRSRTRRRFLQGVIVLLLSALALAAHGQRQAQPGKLQLSFVDADSGQPIPARVELLDEQGKASVADDALLIGGD